MCMVVSDLLAQAHRPYAGDGTHTAHRRAAARCEVFLSWVRSFQIGPWSVLVVRCAETGLVPNEIQAGASPYNSRNAGDASLGENFNG